MESQKNNFWRNIIPLCFVFFLLAGIYSCNNSDVVNNGSIPTQDDSILVTDEFGRVIGGDVTDWCRNSSSDRRFGPAYPNPTNDEVKIGFSLNSRDTISLYFLRGTDSTFLVRDNALEPGLYEISVSASALGFANSYRRLFIQNSRRTYSSSTGCNNFGDIHFR